MTGPGAPTPPATIVVFYSYAHEDEELVKKLWKHLSILKRQGVIREWYDREIAAGTEWTGQIDQHLDWSAGHPALGPCRFPGLRLLLRRRDEAGPWSVTATGTARVIPVILRTIRLAVRPVLEAPGPSQGRQAGHDVGEP